MELRTVKGTKDYAPQEKLLQNAIITTLTTLFERYGYNPLETPGLEMLETLTQKFAGGEEILKEIFTLTDNAQRELGLRYDLTVPFARFIASNPQLKKPFKRYQIGKVWRNGPIKLGRFREFYQCDADVVGISSLAVDAELISLYEQFFNEFKLEGYVLVNNRKLLTEIMEYAKIPTDLHQSSMLSLDKLQKIGEKSVQKELVEKGVSRDSIKILFEIISRNSLEYISECIPQSQGVKELRDVLSHVTSLGCKNVLFSCTLARGLGYYTGTIWEAFLRNSPITSSVGSGGRYDTMIQEYTNTKNPMPAVGASFGVDVLVEALSTQFQKQTVVQVFIIPFENISQSLQIAQQLRKEGFCVDVDLNQRSMKKNLDFVDKLQIPFVVFIGSDEVSQNKLTLKNMQTGEQSLCTLEEVLTLLNATPQ